MSAPVEVVAPAPAVPEPTPKAMLDKMQQTVDMMCRRVAEMQTIFVEAVGKVHVYAEELEEEVISLREQLDTVNKELLHLQTELGVVPTPAGG